MNLEIIPSVYCEYVLENKWETFRVKHFYMANLEAFQ